MRGEPTAIVFVSPGGPSDDRKDQDRAAWHPSTGTACVADGLSSSPMSAQAAEYVVQRAGSLFDHERRGITRIARHLRRRRRDALARSYGSGSTVPTVVLMEAIRSKLERSFQTTVVAAQVGPDRRTVRWLKVGDSRLVAFDAHGDVMADTDSSDTRGSQGRTDALPDHLDRLRSDGFELRAGGVVVLGSDGFFGGFENLAAVRDWALEPREDSLAGLHDRLRRSTGDDDISVVVVRVPA